MPDVLQVFLSTNSYTPESDALSPFNNTQYGEAIDADIGHPLLADGRPVQTAYVDQMTTDVFENDLALPTSATLNERYCPTDPAIFSDKVELRSGDVVSVCDYDVVMVSFLWMYYGYIRYLGHTYPDLGLVGIQEESLQDVMSCSARLQSIHHESLEVLDGVIAVNEQYRNWMSAHVDEVVLQPLPVPEGQFEGVETHKDSKTICVGVGTANMDFSNLYSNILVVTRLRDAGYDVTAEIIGLKPYQRDRFASYGENFEFLSLTGYIDDGYYEHLAEMNLAVLLTTRATTGRPAAEFAGVGVPCIGTPVNAHQRRCFPDLCVDPFDVDEATTLAERLLSEEPFYDRAARTAKYGLDTLQDTGSVRRTMKRLAQSVY